MKLIKEGKSKMSVDKKTFLPIGTIKYTLLFLLSILFLFPLYWTFTNSLQPINGLLALYPSAFHWENYQYALTYIAFGKYLINSVIITGSSVGLTIISSSLVGFGFARLKAPGKNMLFIFILSTMMLPQIVTQIPMYMLFSQVGLTNTYLPWILWGLGGSAFNIFLFRQYYSGLPKELEEAARIDGCSTFRIYWNIFLPISKSVVITAAIMTFNYFWGTDYLTPFMFLKDDKYPLVTAIMQIGFADPKDSNNIEILQVMNAGLMLFMIPIIFLFFLGQRYLAEGIISSGVKG